MRSRLACWLLTILVSTTGIPAIAAPVDFKALPLIPPRAQIVSGFDVRQNPYKTGGGSLLFITANNVFDLRDWVALSGVDPHRTFDEVIYISLAPPSGALSEHLLLITGSFNREHIFRSAELNGAKRISYLAEPVLEIEPFAREKLDMTDTRWLAILDNRIVVFGTPWMVQQALMRSENGVPVDPVLLERLAMFKSDVTCWNLVAAMADSPQAVFLESDGPWSALFEDTDLLMIGVHGDAKVRLDLLLQTQPKSEANYLNRKAAQFSRIFAAENAPDEDCIRHLKNLQIKTGGIRASVLMPAEDFLAWKRGQLAHDKQLFDAARERTRAAASPDSQSTMSALPPPTN